jgi:hypothetical protein
VVVTLPGENASPSTPMTRHMASLSLLLAASLAVAACDLSALDPPSVVPSVAPAPSISASPSFVRPTPLPQPTFLVYVVAAGDTLSSIAANFGTKAQSLAYWNRATYPSLDPESARYDPNRIKIGWTLLLIPFGEVDPEDLPPRSTTAPASSPSPSG